MANNTRSGDVVQVVLVARRDSKRVKTLLEQNGRIHKDFRMAPFQNDPSLIAIPVRSIEEEIPGSLGFGEQFCPYSTRRLSNQRNQLSTDTDDLSLSQQALWNAYRRWFKDTAHLEHIRCLAPCVCPKSLERLGDERLVVIPQKALNPQVDPEFANWIDSRIEEAVKRDQEGSSRSFMDDVWSELASLTQSPRVVRRGEVDPESKVRKSGYEILWPKADGTSAVNGPGSPGWVTVTEQGIRQSFDLSLVMFSRGNISEKIRFGRLVQPGDVVLDLYAGIGYFTLPALVHGKAAHVYACEWNPDAVAALRYNLQDNGIGADRATVLEGDCRVHGERYAGMVDRVSLGLIPSSEGGWRTAVRALKDTVGGWLHVHANVPVHEVLEWSQWLCLRLAEDRKVGSDTPWVTICHHVEKVKSFAPKVNHYVADVWMGPLECARTKWKDYNVTPGLTGVVDKDGCLVVCPDSIDPPSCALSDDGVLHQAWMRERDLS